MKRVYGFTLLTVLLLVGLTGCGDKNSADKEKTGAAEASKEMAKGEMPETGRPAEMDQVNGMIGTWTTDLQVRMDDTSDYISSPCTMVNEAAVDGCAIVGKVKSTFMGMPFNGMAFVTYDREQKKWTESWVDNLSGALYHSEGSITNGTMVLEGSGTQGGMAYMMRETIVLPKDSICVWTMDASYDGGKTWSNIMKANYKKKM